MLSPRAPLSARKHQTLSDNMSNMSLDKENTVRGKVARTSAPDVPGGAFRRCPSV